MRVEAVIAEHHWDKLFRHMFPGDHDEHGAVLICGKATTPEGLRLLVRDVVLAREGRDYVPSPRAYRMLTAEFVRRNILRCRAEGAVYLAVHCHGGSGTVAFSSWDLESHERSYPALLDIADQPVGGLVVAQGAVAGDIWFPDGSRVDLDRLRVAGTSITDFRAHALPADVAQDMRYDRQSRLFGDRGQMILRQLKVGVIGVGGVGSLVVEYLARLGVGSLVTADPDRVELSNLSRLVGASRADVGMTKVEYARRLATSANPEIAYTGLCGDFVDQEIAAHFLSCDYLFLAADSMQARLVFNAAVHQHLIPGMQVGSKVQIDRNTGDVTDVFSVVRRVVPQPGCLLCNGLIPPKALQEESLSDTERAAQRYVDDEDVVAPSVITLNAKGAAQAVDDFVFGVTGLKRHTQEPQFSALYSHSLNNNIRKDRWRYSASCPHCSSSTTSRRGKGSDYELPTRIRC